MNVSRYSIHYDVENVFTFLKPGAYLQWYKSLKQNSGNVMSI